MNLQLNFAIIACDSFVIWEFNYFIGRSGRNWTPTKKIGKNILIFYVFLEWFIKIKKELMKFEIFIILYL